ncbi:MAG TPA: hypothetical protein VG326_13995 [Tepidisphaeraceae bacterium]|nr:hypothetical protein [Tepidisphaeraceae bacterium]
MTVLTSGRAVDVKVDAAALFEKLGLRIADERPILESWRKANSQWRRERLRRVAIHAQRVQEHLRRFTRAPAQSVLSSRKTMGRPKAVWCVELGRRFRTLSDAAAFVDRKPSNISQALKRGVRCGPFHWETYDPAKHGAVAIETAPGGAGAT